MTDSFPQQLSRAFASPAPWAADTGTSDRSSVLQRRCEQICLSAETSARLHAFASEHGLNRRSIMAGAWAILLSRYGQEPDAAFGILEPRAGQVPGVAPVMLRAEGDRLLLPWLSKVQETVMAIRENSAWSLETAVIFDYRENPDHFPLELHVSTVPEFCIAANYDGLRFPPEAILRILGQLQLILESLPAVERISDLPLLCDAELHDLVIARNATKTSYRADMCVHQWFEEQVERTPDATAVVFHGQQLTYRELDQKACRLAARLRELGAVPDGIVALCVNRSLEMMVGLLGILKSGAAYLPIDPAFPPERIEFMLEDSRAPIIVTADHLAAGFPDTRARALSIRSVWDWPMTEELAPSSVDGHNLAYVIYTSGSTGKPKGVMIEHRQVSNFFAAMDQVLGPQPGVWLAVTSISFDISVLELFWTLARGFTVVLQAESEKLASSGDYSVAAQIRNHKVTHLQCTPSMARFLISSLESLESLRGLRKLMLGGEALPSALVAELRPVVSGEMFNLYGPTETTVWSVAHRIVRDEAVIPIGRPIANTQIYLLEANSKPVPPGAPGELFIAGAGVTRGYLNRPGLTAEKFLPNPFDPESHRRMYRTGDLARYRPDGDLEFLGRIDNQVKILGFRIEPEEIETILGQYPDVRAIAVVACEHAPGEKNLIAYVVPGERGASTAELRLYAQQRLPAHMVPTAFIMVDSLPQTPNRKIDKKALAARPLPSGPSAAAPVNLEETVANIFKDALEVEKVGTHDNFFDLGANSLVIAQVAIALHEALHREIPLTDLFKYPTISALTAYLSQRPDEDAPLRRSSTRGQSRKHALAERSSARPAPNRDHKNN